MMNSETVLKLYDAANQMKLALANQDNEAMFRSCINSFVSTARSVTMVMEKECKPINMTDWYKSKMESLGGSPLFKFFNDQRVYSIHKGVIQPIKKGHEVISSKFWYMENKKGEKIINGNAEIEADIPSYNTGDITSFSEDGTMWAWFFDDVKKRMPDDTGNVLRLCETYYLCLKWLVEEWFREQHRRGVINAN